MPRLCSIAATDDLNTALVTMLITERVRRCDIYYDRQHALGVTINVVVLYMHSKYTSSSTHHVCTAIAYYMLHNFVAL
jgi:hypothetical protein